MNTKLLTQHLTSFAKMKEQNPERYHADHQERQEFIDFYQSFDKKRILRMDEDDVYQYLSPLWAMLIWGNKHYVVDKIITDNGLDNFRNRLADLIWADAPIEKRWDDFRKNIKHMGPAMVSEILCKTHPHDYAVWNRRAFVGLNYLGIEGLPRYDYQVNGKMYRHICSAVENIADELKNYDFKDHGLLEVDYFIWSELQVADKLSQIHAPASTGKDTPKAQTNQESQFIHDEVRDKISEIGEWLGFTSQIERRVADGSKVDAIWESTIGNMGRVIYVFEVQTKGSIDSLIINLLKALQNPAVQGVVAVSDKDQIEKIKRHAGSIPDLKEKLKYWDYAEILEVHESLQFVNGNINKLGLVPEGF